MPQRIFLTGGSGFVGSAVLRELLGRHHAVTALYNRHALAVQAPEMHAVQGDLFNTDTLRQALADCDAVIHLVGIIAENPRKNITFERVHHAGTGNLVDAAKAAGARRFVHMSALGVRADAVSAYHRSKWRAEEYVRASGLDWTILRPSLIHGPGGEFMRMEASWARGTAPPYLFMPYFGAGLFGAAGAGRLQPVYVNDVARAFVDALDKPQTIGKTYELAGPDRLTWPQLHAVCSEAITGKKRRAIPLPAWYATLLTRIVPRALLPFNRDQVIMSQEDNTTDSADFTHDFGWRPAPFEPTLRTYAAQL